MPGAGTMPFPLRSVSLIGLKQPRFKGGGTGSIPEFWAIFIPPPRLGKDTGGWEKGRRVHLFPLPSAWSRRPETGCVSWLQCQVQLPPGDHSAGNTAQGGVGVPGGSQRVKPFGKASDPESPTSAKRSAIPSAWPLRAGHSLQFCPRTSL